MMLRSILKFFIYCIVISVLISACAKVSAPTGGPRDRTPPVITGSTPENGARNFKGNRIEITFNEYVTLDKITEKLMVSPPLGKKPQVMIRGKNVIIEYDEELRDSTTYTFYFGDAIRDLNEGNIMDNYQFVFSTGAVIDSLSVKGSVINSFSLSPAENSLVLLYSDLSDSAFIKELPAYISKTDKDGNFSINNVRPGTYNLFALNDADNSRNFNLPDEEIAFHDTRLSVTPENNYLPSVSDTTRSDSLKAVNTDTLKTLTEYKLFLFKPAKKMRYLTSSSRDNRYLLSYTLSLPPDSLDFTFSIPGSAPGSYFIERSREKDTMVVWLRDSILFSEPQLNTLINYPLTDSTGMVVQKQDTILMRFLIPRTTTRGKAKPVIFRVASGLASGSLRPGSRVIFKSETPFRPPDTSKIRLYELKGADKVIMPFRMRTDTLSSCKMTLDAALEKGKNYLFIADSAAFGSIYGESSDSSGYKFSIRNEDTFGRLLLNINNFEGNNIIQLLSAQENFLKEIVLNMNGKAEFGLLDKGIYRVRAVYDLNNDGKWTTGEYAVRRQPEPVTFYHEEIDVKENWNFENNWDISEKNIKKLKPPAGMSGGR